MFDIGTVEVRYSTLPRPYVGTPVGYDTLTLTILWVKWRNRRWEVHRLPRKVRAQALRMKNRCRSMVRTHNLVGLGALDSRALEGNESRWMGFSPPPILVHLLPVFNPLALRVDGRLRLQCNLRSTWSSTEFDATAPSTGMDLFGVEWCSDVISC